MLCRQLIASNESALNAVISLRGRWSFESQASNREAVRVEITSGSRCDAGEIHLQNCPFWSRIYELAYLRICYFQCELG